MQVESVSIVVPCHNEEQSLRTLVSEVAEVFEQLPQSWHLILVDDGSSDGTASQIEQLASQYDEVRGVIFSRNFGKEPAMLAGLSYADSDAVLIMDADLQHPPRLIPQLIEAMEQQGVDQVVAMRDREGDSKFRSALSRMYYRFSNRLMENVQLVDGAGDFRLLSKRAVDTLLALDERSRFSKGLFSWIGYPTAYVKYKNEQRVAGASSWSTAALFNYGWDGVVSFNAKPLRVVAGFGGLMFVAALLYLIWLVIDWTVTGTDTPGYITTLAAIIGFSGIQLLALGVIGEYVGRIYQEVKRRPHYVVNKEVGF